MRVLLFLRAARSGGTSRGALASRVYKFEGEGSWAERACAPLMRCEGPLLLSWLTTLPRQASPIPRHPAKPTSRHAPHTLAPIIVCTPTHTHPAKEGAATREEREACIRISCFFFGSEKVCQ